MSEKRRDSRGRILHNGEMQMSDGRYRYKYLDSFGKEKVIYSWRLDHNDKMPVENESWIELTARVHYMDFHGERRLILEYLDSTELPMPTTEEQLVNLT